jgi:ATP:ADP antiporter, AAA family
MLGGLVQVRSAERRPTAFAFLTLMCAMAAHGLLETARDALFLARLPATRLPFVYLAVAALAVLLTALPLRRGAKTSRAGRLSLLLVGCGALTLAFFPLVDARGTWSLYALYVWSATVATLVVARFWLVVSERFDVTQAKRLYAVIGAGSVLGAIVGTGLAGALTLLLPARYLLLAAGGLFALAGAGPLLLDRSGALPQRPAAAAQAASAGIGARALESPYVRRVALLVLLSTVAVTAVDYAFKSEVAEHVARDQLGSFFARFYLLANFVSLAAQLLLVRFVVRATSITGSLAVLPVLLASGGIVIAAGGGLAAALGTKGLDAALRHSLHRTAVELLYVPMVERVRSGAKLLADVLGQRGGQALASLGILVAVALGASEGAFGLAIAVTAAAWVGVALGLRPHYLELFRSTLREAAQQPRVQYPELDLSSLESVIAALNSRSDAEVRAALHYLADEGRARLIPALILYHPSIEVVVDAIELLIRAGRRDFGPIIDRLLEHPAAAVRAAALRAKTRIDPDRELLERFASSACVALRTTALVGLEGLGHADDERMAELELLATTRDPAAKIALADAIRFRPSGRLEELLPRLAKDPSVEVRRAVLAAMAAAPSARYLPVLVQMLGVRQLRSEARATLVELGDMALSFLSGALADPERPVAIRRHIPRTLMRFDPQKAARALLDQLVAETDGSVRFKILRALGFLRSRNPGIELDRRVLDELVKATVSKIYQLIEWRVGLERGKLADPRRDTPTGELLARLLRDKEAHAIERLFRLLGLAYRSEDVATIYRGLRSGRPDVRASSRELVEHLLEQPLRAAVLGLIDDAPDLERLAQAGPFIERALPSYEQALIELLESAGRSLQSIAVYHIRELGLGELPPRLDELDAGRPSALDSVTRRALELLSAVTPRPKAAAS